MSHNKSSREIFKKVAMMSESAREVSCKPLRPSSYVRNNKSLVALIRTEERLSGIAEAVRILGGVEPVVHDLGGDYVLVKPNCNSHDPFPASTHPDTLRFVVRQLLDAGLDREQIVVGDMSGPAWLPTEYTMRRNGILGVTKEFNVGVSFFEEEEWVKVKPRDASSWPEGFRIASRAYNAARIISLPCLKTHQFGGVFTLSLKNSVGLINPADRTVLHKKPGDRIAEINLAYTPDLIVLDGLECFISGGPAQGEQVHSGVVIAGSDRIAVDTIGVAILKFHKADGIVDVQLKDHEQLKHAEEIGVGSMDSSDITFRTANLANDDKFDDLLAFIKDQL